MDVLNYDAVRLVLLGAVLLLILLAERHTAPARSSRALGTNIGLWCVDTALLRVVCGACGFTVAAWCAARGIGLVPALSLPRWAAIVLSVFVLDAVSYFWHRANHRFDWLWRLHRIHHADRVFQVTTALRFHPGELLLALPVRLAAIALFGIPVLGVLVFELCFGAMNLLVHGDLAWPKRVERVLSRVLVTPSMHRLHHARLLRYANTNFGTLFSLFDRHLRSFASVPALTPIETGVVEREGDRQMSFTRALVRPFVAAKP